MNRENTSLSDDSPEVRALLRAGISEEVDYDFDRGLSMHLAAVGVVPIAPHVGGAPGAAAAAVPSAAAALSAKALFALVGVPIAFASVAAALWFGSVPKERPSEPTAGAAAPKSPVAPVAAPVPTEPTIASSPTPAAVVVQVPSADQAGAPDRSIRGVRPGVHHHYAVTLAETPDVASGAATKPSTLEQGNVAPPEQGASAAVTDSTASDAPAAPSAAQTSATEEPSKPATKPDDSRAQAQERLAREMDQLVQAKRALTDDPNKALLLAERGQREFPHSVFAEERQQILLLALIGVGRTDDARRLAAPYLQSHPDSPFARRVQKALAGK